VVQNYIREFQVANKDYTITIDTDNIDTWSSIGEVSLDTITTTINSISTDTIDISTYTTSSDDQISFDWDNIEISPTLWTEVLPNVDTVNDMCKEYPALAKAYENFKTVYKLVEQDYKGKQEDD
jgi:hypothetical protein